MKKTNEILAIIFCLLGTTIVCPHDGGAFQPLGNRWGGSRATMSIVLNVNDPIDQGGRIDIWNALAEDALAAWNNSAADGFQVPGSRFSFFFNNSDENACDRFSVFGTSNAVEWASDTRCGGVFSPGDLAVTFKTDNPITGNVNNADVLFRRDLAEGWTSADPGFRLDGPVNFSTVAIHEFGHVLGLDHEDRILAQMESGYHPYPGQLHADDRRGVRSRYPGPGTETDIGPSNWTKKSPGPTAELVLSPSSAMPGETITMEWTQENFGTTSASFNIGFFLSTDIIISPSEDTLLGRNLGAFVTAGFSATFSRDVTIPAGISPGIYFLGVCLDDDNALAERLENNNCLPHPRTIAISGVVNNLVSLVQLTTSDNPTPVPDGPGGTFTISATFTNTTSTPIAGIFFEVTELSGGNLLLNADGGAGGVGARLTPNVGADGVFSPGEAVTIDFIIGLAGRGRFTFLVNALGVPTPPGAV